MDRERRALVAFALLAALVVVPIAFTSRHGDGGREATRAPLSSGVRYKQVVEWLHRQQLVHRRPAAGAPVLHLPAGCGQAAPPVFPGARRARSLGNESGLLRELNRLGRTARLTDLATFTMGPSGWLADTQTGLDVFRWYDGRMEAVQFWRMGRSLRSLIGVRPAGLVDSPPLLYVNRQAAVLIRQIGRDRMGLLVAASCSGAETV